MSGRLRVGMGQPYAIRVTVAASADFDPSTPIGATLKVTKPNGERVDWSGTIETQSATSITVRYSLAPDGLDLDQKGTWLLWIQWTVTGQSPGPRTEVATFPVLSTT